MENKVYFTKPFLLLWFGMLISTMGTFIFLLYLSANLFMETKSSILAGGVFAAQWLPSIFLFPLIVFICSKSRTKLLLSMTELISAVISLTIGIIYKNGYIWVLIFLFIRGFLEHTMKSSRLIALKKYFSKEELEKASSLFNTSYYLGAALGGGIGTFIIAKLDFMVIAELDALTFIIAAIIYYYLPKLENDRAAAEKKVSHFNITKVLEITRLYPRFFEFFLYLLISAGIYDGFHSIARTVIPLNIYKTNVNGVTIYETITCISLIIASFVVYRFLCNKTAKFHPVVLVIITSISMIFTILFPNYLLGFLTYFVFIFFYEVLYTVCMNYLVVYAPEDSFHSIAVTINSLTVGSVVIFIFLGGTFIDFWGIKPATYLLSFTAVFLCLLVIVVKTIGNMLIRKFGAKNFKLKQP
jgi:MFS family permease